MIPTLSNIIHMGLVGIGAAGVAFAAATEIACYSVNPVRLSIRSSGGDPAARCLQGELARPDRMLAVVMLAANLFNYLLAVGIEPLLNPHAPGPPDTHTLSSEWQGVLIDIAVLTPLLLIFGESLPKELARVHADRLAYWLARPLFLVRLLATGLGVLPLIMGVSRRASRLSARLGGPAGGSEHLGDGRQRIALLLKEGSESGVLSESQTTLVDRALTLRKVTVRDEMIRWSKVRTLDTNMTRDEALRAVGSAPHSQFPVVDRSDKSGGRGVVVGIVRQIDLHVNPDRTPAQLMRPTTPLDPEMHVTDAVRVLASIGARVGVVEQGGRPIGMVTLRDLFEPLTGELPDW